MCYLPLCHVAERCYSEVMQLVLGGSVNFAESIDTVALNIREIAPTFFVGVPRIYEKLQQDFLFRSARAAAAQQSLSPACFALRPHAVGPAAEHGRLAAVADRLGYALLYLLMFRNIQRHLGLNRSRHRLCAGASISPETLRFFDIVGRPVSQGYGLTESGGVAFVQPGQPSPARRLRPAAAAVPNGSWTSDGEILLRNPGVFKGYFLDERPRPPRWSRADGCAPATSSRSWTMARSPWSTARRRSSSPPAARTSRLPRSRTR